MVFRDDIDTMVVAFTASQIPGIADRSCPPSRAGPRYPSGTPLVGEEHFPTPVREHRVDGVVLAYSDC